MSTAFKVAIREYREDQEVRDRKTGATGRIAAVSENCVTVWLDDERGRYDARTLHLEPHEADWRLEVFR